MSNQTEERFCLICGTETWRPCTNGLCAECHDKYCTPGGNTSPGHNLTADGWRLVNSSKVGDSPADVAKSDVAKSARPLPRFAQPRPQTFRPLTVDERANRTPPPWTPMYHLPGNTVQHGLAGFSIQGQEGIAYCVCRPANASLIGAAPELYQAAVAAAGRMLDLALALERVTHSTLETTRRQVHRELYLSDSVYRDLWRAIWHADELPKEPSRR